ncbi:hypothetical protein A8C56_06490 [Niabella ginsenosidivorans]|uniref:Uncharacterized protein n=1 Tax=Niabella ginsenosidivorans TaxID=1176587 RepID=A0A1A9I1T8_9BACT|nr:hypothetical protein [Niabella ginsenosidivorans]ANH80671.1 hypothetical protein A8C56_06490 [Niabella ginsenosidivorans]
MLWYAFNHGRPSADFIKQIRNLFREVKPLCEALGAIGTISLAIGNASGSAHNGASAIELTAMV